jgi:superfamily II DNA or RNA helicase
MGDVWNYIENSNNDIDLIKSDNSIKSDKSDKSAKYNKSDKSIKTNKLDCNGLEIIVCQKGIKININKLQELDIYRKLINYFTISIPQLGGYIKKVSNHKILKNGGQIVFPRFGMLNYIENNFTNYNIVNNIKSGLNPSVEFKWTGKFTNNQPIVADHIMQNYFNKNNSDNAKSGVILNLDAGQGKTYLATGLIEKLQRKTLIVCHTISILNQWVQVLKSSYPNNTIARYFGGIKEDGDICVAIINSLLMDKLYNKNGCVEPINFFQEYGYVIFDEIHLYSSLSRKQIYNKCQRKYMLGLSATPDENKDGLDLVNTWNCGDVLNAANIEGYTMEDIPFKGEVTSVRYIGNPEYIKILINDKMDIVNHSGMVNQICEDPYRLHIIVKLIFNLRESNQNIFIFADRRSYLLKIESYMSIFGLKSNNLFNESDVTKLMGGASAETMDRAKDEAKVILTTYAFMGTGVSIPRMDAIILATPRKTKSRQYVNRIFRLGGDYEIVRKIIDIVDWGTHMKSQWYKRKKYYNEKQYPIINKKIKWDDMNEEMIQMGLNIPKTGEIKELHELDKSLLNLEQLIKNRKLIWINIVK